MSIDVERLDEPAKWDGIVERSSEATVFHRYAFCATVAEHADCTFHPLVGYKGQEPVGVFPLFSRTWGPIRVAFSPPPEMGLSQLGPAMVVVDGMKRRSIEKRAHRFIDACLEWLDETVAPVYVHLRTTRHQRDCRPFEWHDFEIQPRYTYVVDLRPGPDAVVSEFSSDARRNARTEAGFEIDVRGHAAIDRIVDHLDRRHAEQGIEQPVTAAFVHDLYDRLPDGALRPYVCTVDGAYASGMLALTDESTAYRWQGGAAPEREVDVPVNDLLDWRVMTDGMDEGRSWYDLVGANTPGLMEYKSKFGPELATYQVAVRASPPIELLASAYRRLPSPPMARAAAALLSRR